MSIVWSTAIAGNPKPLRRGSGGSYASMTIRTPNSTGPANVRRRSSAAVRPFSLSFLLTEAQREDLDTMYHTTCKGGALSFEMADPVTGTTENWRFTSPPSWSEDGPDLYRVSFGAEQLP